MPSPQDRLLHVIKARGPQTAETIARHLGVTIPAVRKQLDALLAEGLVEYEDEAGRVGRPRRIWSLTEAVASRFPDSHASLNLELIEAIRELLGDSGLDQLIAIREKAAHRRYAGAMQGSDGLEERLARLASLRSDEGYMASCEPAPGGYLLIENHCPICAAARSCQGFCRSELQLFRQVLGPGVDVERTDHIAAGARRCAYRVTPRP